MRVRHERRRGACSLVAPAIGLAALGCGTPASLDANGHEASSSGMGSATLSGTTGTSTEDSASAGDAPPDVLVTDLPETPPPPGECPLECEIELPLVWAWDDTTRDPPDPSGQDHLSAMLQGKDGSWFVASVRDGQPWITRVDAWGELVSSEPLSLGCDCEILELALYPSGEIALLGEGSFDDLYTVLTVARIEASTMTLYAQAWGIINGTADRPARVGTVLPMDEEHAAVVVTESQGDGQGNDVDTIRLFVYEYGNLDNLVWVDSQPAIGPPHRPKGVVSPSGALALTIPGAGGLGTNDYVVWMDPATTLPLGTQSLPGQADAMVVDPNGGLVVAGHTLSLPESPESLSLQATGLPNLLPPAWEYSTDAPSRSTSLPVLAMDALGHTYLAARISAGEAGEADAASLMLTRLDEDGAPTWSTTLPLPVEASPLPVAIATTDDPGPDLVIAAFVDGRLHLERREQTCACD